MTPNDSLCSSADLNENPACNLRYNCRHNDTPKIDFDNNEEDNDDRDYKKWDSPFDDADIGEDEDIVEDEDDVSSEENKDSEDDAEIVRPEMHPHLKAEFCITRGKFYVPLEEGLIDREIYKLDVEKTRVFLKNAVPMSVSSKCYLSFYGERQNKNSFVMYAKCRYKECSQRFKFDIAHYAYMPLTVFVYSTDMSKELHPNDHKFYYQLTAQERRSVQEKLEYMMSRQMELAEINTIDVELAKAGNMQALRSLSVYQKAKSEDNAKYDLTLQSKDLQDLMQLRVEEKKLHNPYLQHTHDLNAIMFSEETIRAVGPRKILRGDATGNCCRAPAGGDYKRILYYAFVVSICGVVLPILEFITSEYNVMEITLCLMRFRYFVEAMKDSCWPYFDIVIVDWSWALIHAIMKEWNDTDIYIYLRRTCNYVLYGKAYPEKWIIVHNCAVDFLKRVSDKIDEVHNSFQGKDFVMD